jgi:MAC/Perforin domain
MGKFYIFAPLKGGNGSDFKQIEKVKEYKKAAKAGNPLIGEGLCAAMCMSWLDSGKVPTDEEFEVMAGTQAQFNAQWKNTQTADEEIRAMGSLANKFDLKVGDAQPRCGIDDADDYWSSGIPDMGLAISKYTSGEVVSTELPCFLQVRIKVPDAQICGKRYPVEFFPLTFGHGVALKRRPPANAGVVYHYYDPNAGVYEIRESAMASFFARVELCYLASITNRDMDIWYRDFQKKVQLVQQNQQQLTAHQKARLPELVALSASLTARKEAKDAGVEGFELKLTTATASVHLIRAYALKPLFESTGQSRPGVVLPGITTIVGQPVEPKQSGGRVGGGGRRAVSVVRPNEEFAAFLRKRGVSGDAVLAVLVGFGVNSLYELKTVKDDPEILGQLTAKLKDYPIAKRALDKLGVEAIDNAIFYSEREGAEADAEALADFLADHDVVGEGLDRDVLVNLLIRSGGVASLEGLKRIKEKGKNDAKLAALTRRIAARSAEAGSNFDSITAGMVRGALSGGGSDAQASQQLTDFVAKKGLPGRTAGELAAFGITTLAQLKIVKEDDAPGGRLEQLRTRLADSGILGAAETIDGIKVAEIEEEIAEAKSPDAQRAREKRAQLVEAIQQVQQLRDRVVKAVGDDFASVQAGVEKEYNAVRQRVNDVSAAEVAAAISAGEAGKQNLISFLDRAIKDVTATKDILDGVEKKKRPVAEIIEKQQMLCGFLISPAGATRMSSEELVKLPKNPEDMSKDSERAFNETFFEYKRSETNSYAASVAQQASTTLAATAEASGAAFVGSGVAAVSAAASYADAQKKSQDEQTFESASKASCGQIRSIDVSKKAVQFKQGEIHLSDAARQRLDEIVRLGADHQEDAIRDFYEKYGSHFFLRYSLGGRYQFTATGKSETNEAKGMLVAAVADTTDWAVSAAGSYAGIGGAFSAAAGVKGQKSVADAKGDRFGLKFDDATVSVATKVIGGAGLAPRDIWAQSLDYNSTWAVIDRDQPRGVWELVTSDTTLSNDIKKMSPLLEKVWVRNIFFDAVKKTDPILYGYLKKDPTLSTCKLLTRAIEELDREAKQLVKEPELNVVVVTATSDTAQHPAVSTRPPRQGLKLIGGGAIVDMPLGQPGNLLFASYPERDSWVAAAKDHKWSSPQAFVKAYGIYLDDPDDLWDVKVVAARTDAPSTTPEVTAILPPGYALTGGGAKITWTHGLLLKESRPTKIQGEYRGWTAKGTDHLDPDVGTAEAFVIGIRPKNGAQIPPTNVYSADNKDRDKARSGVYWPTLELGAQSSEEVIVGGGAATGYDPPPPSLLTGSGLTPDSQKWFAAARTHVPPGSPSIAERQYVELTTWVICRKGRLIPA